MGLLKPIRKGKWKAFGVDYRITNNHLHIYGTNHWAEWIVNFFALPVKTAIGKVHLGWWLFSLTIYSEIKSQLQPGFTFSGHSLGGPIVLYLVKAYHRKGLEASRGWTFGSPAVGDSEFSRTYPIPVVRHVTQRDLIPWVPMWLSHVGLKDYHKIPWTGFRDFFNNHQPAVYKRFTDIKL